MTNFVGMTRRQGECMCAVEWEQKVWFQIHFAHFSFLLECPKPSRRTTIQSNTIPCGIMSPYKENGEKI
jgi:hypothetical protein